MQVVTTEQAIPIADLKYEHLVPPGLQRVGANGMRCTLLHAIGLGRDDVDTDTLVKDVASRVSTTSAFILTFGRPAIGPFAIEFGGWPGRPFTELVDAVTRATARAGAAFKPAPGRYPHTSVAYTTADAEHHGGTCGANCLTCPQASGERGWLFA